MTTYFTEPRGHLIDAAKQIGREGLYLHVNKDNARALDFYRKSGFAIAGEDVNPRSGAPVYMMTWRPPPLDNSLGPIGFVA